MDFELYSEDIVEKIQRLSEILITIADAKILKEHLSLCGGTALNLLHLDSPPRLSEDLDFNYRHFGDEDWGRIRDMIDMNLKRILDKLGYPKESIKIQPYYNLNRFFISYETENGKKDQIKIEIGYMRRIPDLRLDDNLNFHHPAFPRTVKILTPKKEELFANKFVTMLSRMRRRPNARDVFDVLTISELDFNVGLFSDIVILETILMDLQFSKMKFIQLEKSDLKTLAKLVLMKPELEIINNKVNSFTKTVQKSLEKKKINDFQREFIKNGKVRLDLLENPDQVHPGISEHPQLLWLLKKHGE
jgi:predicted nucleotidyltransferase component of viral defense system